MTEPIGTRRWLPRGAWWELLGLVLGVQVWVNWQAPLHFDAAWFAEEAWWLLRNGRVRSEMFLGINGWEEQMFVFHKLFVYTEALVMQVVSTTPTACQLVLGTGLGL